MRGKVGWQSPSNIALIKYWGKRPVQIPQNPSVSLTLSEAHTNTAISFRPRSSSQWVKFSFHGTEKPEFAERIIKYFSSIVNLCPFITEFEYDIKSENTFPHSSGIASSASSMSALSLCLCSIEEKVTDAVRSKESFYQRASFLARLGSGSACRSIYPVAAVWGASGYPFSSDEYAVEVESIHPVFDTYCDTILIVSPEKKAVSSSAGHDLMNDHPFAKSRFSQARDNFDELLQIMQKDELQRFCEIVEEEALTLHALMMCSRPSYTLLKPGTLEIIEQIRKYRSSSGIPLCFTLDAGPNVHVLYPLKYKEKAHQFIADKLIPITASGKALYDHVGRGPKRIDI